MRRRTGAMAVVCAAVAFLAAPALVFARTWTVYPSGPVGFQNTLAAKTGGGVNSFMIDKITINAGDTVAWNGKARANGFHSVDFPALGGSDLQLIVPSGGLVSGANDFSGNPFWFNGKVPNVGFNPKLGGRIGGATYNGSSRVDSGLPFAGPATPDYKLKFTKPGLYKYFCDVHYGMVGWVRVLAKGKKVPSPAADQAQLKKAEKAYTASAKKLDHTQTAAGHVSLGVSGPGGLEIFAMFPGTLHVTAGTTVTFSMSHFTRETHTATFGPTPYVMNLANSFAGPAPSPIAVYPSDPPGTITLSPSSHGNGFANTGALDRDSLTPLPPSGTIKFTKAGIYIYHCLIHPFMVGKVVVS